MERATCPVFTRREAHTIDVIYIIPYHLYTSALTYILIIFFTQTCFQRHIDLRQLFFALLSQINSFANSFEAPPELLEPIRAPWPSEMTTMDSFNQPNACADRMSWSSIASGYEPDMPIKVVSRDVPPAPLALSKPQMKGVLAPPNIGSQRHGRRLEAKAELRLRVEWKSTRLSRHRRLSQSLYKT